MFAIKSRRTISALLLLGVAIAWIDYRGNNYIESLRTRSLRVFFTTVGNIHALYGSATSLSPDDKLTTQLEEVNGRNDAISLYMQSVIHENNQLKQLLYYHASDSAYGNSAFITTKIMGHIASLSSGFASLAIGSADGLKPGQAVINSKGLVGRVVSASEHLAEVMLITNPKFRIPVIMRDSNERAMFNGSAFALSFPGRHPKIFDGEMAMTLGDQKGFPSYIPVGIVRASTGLSVMISHIDVFADMGKLDYVMVIIGNDTVDTISQNRDLQQPGA